MFRKTYVSALRTIVRSPLTWGAIALFLGIGIYNQIVVHYGIIDMNTLEMIPDTDPGFVMTFKFYIQEIRNCAWSMSLMLFTAPALCVITSGVVLSRDWRDNFFEVDRAGGVAPRKYFFGRYTAVVSFVTAVSLFGNVIFLHLYFLVRRGVENMTFGRYLADSTFRVVRLFFTAVFPGLLVFVGITFLAANLMRNGIAGMITGLSYVVLTVAARVYLNYRLPSFVTNYLLPSPFNLYMYWAEFDMTWFTDEAASLFFTKGEALTCLLCLYSISAVCLALSFLCVKKRRV